VADEQEPDPAPGAAIERAIDRYRFVLAGLLALLAIGIVGYNYLNRPVEQPLDTSAPSTIVSSVRTSVLSTDASDAVTALRWTVTGATATSWVVPYDADERVQFAAGGPADAPLTLTATLIDDRTGMVLARASAAKSALAANSFTSQCEAVAGMRITCTPVWGAQARWEIEVTGSVSPAQVVPLSVQ
jgi:hypothetical protein